MHLRPVIISIILHAAVFAVATAGLPWLKRDFDIPPPISVEFVEISKITQTDKVAEPVKPKEEKKEPEKKEPPKPPPAAKNTAKEAVVPVKAQEKKEKPAPKKDTVDENKLPEKKEEKKPEKKKEEKKKKAQPARPERDFASVLRNLDIDDSKPRSRTEEPDLNPDEKTSSQPGARAPLGAKLTMSEEDALRRQLEGCWNVPFGAKDAENLVVEIHMLINPDRTLRMARVVDERRYNKDTFFRAAADSALRAVRSPLCSPFELPPDKYELWKETTVTFNPRDMF